jgi:hypothetical protein
MVAMRATISVALLFFTLGVLGQTEDLDQSNSTLALPFDIPDWLIQLIPDYGGALPFLATDKLASVDCEQITRESSSCRSILGEEGVFVCRKLAGLVSLSLCTPTVEGNVLGVRNDVCGCCGQTCPEQCGCLCNEGRGVMIETKIVSFWPVKLCVTHNMASYLTPIRQEIHCDTSCLAD